MINTGTTCKTTKRYPRVTAGPLRHKYIHRIVAAALVAEEKRFDGQIQEAKKNGKPWEAEDGKIKERWENLKGATA